MAGYATVMDDFDWPEMFRRCYDRAVIKYREGNDNPASYFDEKQTAFLSSIGCSVQEIYDFAEDWCRSEEPSFATVLLITAARRDYFLVVQHGKPSGHTIRMDELPPGGAEAAGFRWLPRIIAKARAKLRGEMPRELMYGCGGDRPFLRSVNIHPADFLREVWAARDDDQKIIEYVKAHAGKPGN